MTSSPDNAEKTTDEVSRRDLSARATRRLLLLVLIIGCAARFFGLNWDNGAGQHPDERHLTMCTWRLEWPKSVGEYFDEAQSPLNPRNREAHFYAYGTLPGTMLRGVVEVGGIKKPEQMGIAGRVLSALADTTVIGLVFTLGWILYRRRCIALLAAFFYAVAVLPIQHAHFFVVDPFANMFVAGALCLLARAWRSGRWYDFALTGVSLGLAVSCKISVASFGLPVALVALLPKEGQGRTKINVRAWLRESVLRTAVYVLAMVITVRLAMPDAFNGFWPWQLAPRWVANMREVIAISTGVTDIPFTRQFYGRMPLVWPWWNMAAWGLGLALGLTAWAAWGAALWKIVRKQVWAHAIPVLWVAVVFFHLGFTYQATLRYFLPIYGCLCVLAAWALVEVSARRKYVGRVLIAGVMLFTSGWALAFLSIYTKPHTRIEASRWIYEHVPANSVLACEHWDDWLPLPLIGNRSPERYEQIELPLYVADDGEKRGELLAKLNRADYIVMSSQKLRDSIPRMPHRYPFTISYYEGLEDGSLGFDLVASFTRTMQLGPIKISTRSAEEAFSVYDHPPVMIYKKSNRYDAEALVRRFNAISLDGVTDTRSPQKPQPNANTGVRERKQAPGRPESAILLSPERWRAAQQEGTWSEMFDRSSWTAKHSVLIWVLHLITLQALGWALLGPLLRKLPDRGAALARPFAVLIPAWLLWLLASAGLARNDRPTYWLIFAGLAGVGAWMSWRSRSDWRAWSREGNGVGAAMRSEVVFWGAFLVFLLIRAANPDVWHAYWGGEKPMEMTFLYGVLKSEVFPPINPWYAGGFINYYYFGYVLCGTLIKGLGVLPEVGFNLCLATFFALACAATFSVARALRPAGSWLIAWSATALVMVLGNLFEIRFIWRQLLRLGRVDHDLTFPLISDVIRVVHGVGHVLHGEKLAPYAADLYWVSARAISGDDVAPVTEFPYWSFLYGDLHPHLLALPFTLCVIGLLVVWVKTEDLRTRFGLILLLGLNLGFFWPTNTWDWPTYGALTGLMIFLGFWREDQTVPKAFAWALGKSLAVFTVIQAVGYVAFLPYHRSYVAGYGSFEWWTGNHTSLDDYLFVHGLFLFILGSALVAALRRRAMGFSRDFRLWVRAIWLLPRRGFAPAENPMMRLGLRNPVSVAGAFVAMALILLTMAVLFRGSLTALLVAGMVISIWVLWGRRGNPLQSLPALLTLIAFGLSLLVEHVVLVGDIGRMNTVFKFYYQVWVCYGLAAAVTLPGLLIAWRGWSVALKRGWATALILLVVAAALYPLLATPAKIRDRFQATDLTLDGLIFGEKAEYEIAGRRFPLKPDLEAIRWLQDNISGSPVILEVNTGSQLYSWGSRFAIHTGLPSIVGWSWHQRQQQSGILNNQVEERIADTLRIYQSTDPSEARRLMAKYNVQLIVVGELERAFVEGKGLEKFSAMPLEKIYDNLGVQIYRVPGPIHETR
jgi:YYY domain-containing protein